jgi:uncharacterized protein (TIGR03083 family)
VSDVSSTLDLLAQADAVAAEMATFLESLPADQWSRESACVGWSIANVVGHLVLVEQLVGGSVTRGLRGDSGPAQQALAGLDAWRTYRQNEIQRLGKLAPTELVELFVSGLPTVQEPLRELGSSDPGDRLGWHPSGQMPLSWFGGQWLVEIALHDWDIRSAVDSTARVSSAAEAGLGPEMRDRMPRCVSTDRLGDASGVVTIVLEGATGRCAWRARLDSEGVEV